MMGIHEVESKKAGGKETNTKDGKHDIDTLYALFLSHLLRPGEWTSQLEGHFFAFRREHIIALAEECQKVLEC
jgi:hypothetical protein